MEYICVKKHQNKFEKSVCIVSEFAGCNKALGGAIKTNPYDIENISHKIDEAISMSSSEKEQRMEQSYEYVIHKSTSKWVKKFLTQLKICRSNPNEYQYMKIGFGLNWQVIRSKKGYQELDFGLTQERYANSKMRFIAIDQEGVIPFKMQNGKNLPTNEAVNALNNLSKDPKNIVFLVSPESKSKLHEYYSVKAPNLGLAAENGFYWRWNSIDKSINDWHQLIHIEDCLWIKQVRLIMEQYNNKTDGSYIDEKESNIIWNYEHSDWMFGKLQAKELSVYLKNVFEHLPIQILES